MSADRDWDFTDLGEHAGGNQPRPHPGREVIEDLRAKPASGWDAKTTDQQQDSNAWRRARPGAGAPQGTTAPQPAASYISIQPTDRRPSMSRLMTRPRSTSLIPASRLFWALGPASLSGRCGNNNYWNWGNGRDLSANLGRLFGLEWQHQQRQRQHRQQRQPRQRWQ